MSTNSKSSPATRPDPKQQALDTIKKWIGAKTSTFEALLGSPEAAKRFGQVLILACVRNPALLACDLKSLFLAALFCAQRGLEPGVQDGCALVPYKGQVVPVPQYRALVKQAIETGSVKSAKAILIHANDTVEWEEGMNPRFIHKPAPFGNDRGPVVGAYARIILPDGSVEIEPMTLDQIYKRRDSSAAWRDPRTRNSTPWALWEEEMIRKTALKNGLRTIPVAPRLRDLLEADNRMEGGAPVEAVIEAEADVLDVYGEQEDKPQTRADALADMLADGQEQQENVEGPQEEQPRREPEAEPEVSEPEPEPEQTNQTELKEALQALYSQATRKNIVGLVLEQFKMSQWEDFLAFPEMIGTLEAFISNYKEPRGRGRK